MATQMKGRKKAGKKRVMRRFGKSPEIHCMLIPTDPETLLLPTSTMAEVIDYTVPEAMDTAPPWLLGQVEWEGRQVPVFSFTALINGTDPGEVPAKPKIMIRFGTPIWTAASPAPSAASIVSSMSAISSSSSGVPNSDTGSDIWRSTGLPILSIFLTAISG